MLAKYPLSFSHLVITIMKVEDHLCQNPTRISSVMTNKNQFTTVFTALAAATLAQADLVERSGTKLTQAVAASRLSAGGVGWTSSGGCSDKNNPTCTSFDGVYSGTVDGAITLKRACGCTVTITGGTETGHASGTYRSVHSFKAATASFSMENLLRCAYVCLSY